MRCVLLFCSCVVIACSLGMAVGCSKEAPKPVAPAKQAVRLPKHQRSSARFYWGLQPGPQILEARLDGHEDPQVQMERVIKPGEVIDIPVPPFSCVSLALPAKILQGAQRQIPEDWHVA